MTEYRRLGPDEYPDRRLGDEVYALDEWVKTGWEGEKKVKQTACEYRRPIKQEEKSVTEFKVGDPVKIARKVVPVDWTDVWIEEMDAAVGKTGVIDRIGIRYPNQLSVEMADGSTGYNYPKEALELVTSSDGSTEEPVVKEPSPQVYDWLCGSSAIYGVSEDDALEWFQEHVRRVAGDTVEGESTVTLYRSHSTATIKKTVEISVKSVDGAE